MKKCPKCKEEIANDAKKVSIVVQTSATGLQGIKS